jgi:hypothetical protein
MILLELLPGTACIDFQLEVSFESLTNSGTTDGGMPIRACPRSLFTEED